MPFKDRKLRADVAKGKKASRFRHIYLAIALVLAILAAVLFSLGVLIEAAIVLSCVSLGLVAIWLPFSGGSIGEKCPQCKLRRWFLDPECPKCGFVYYERSEGQNKW